MDIVDNVYVMSEMTWELWESHLMERATTLEKPLLYIELISILDVLIDNSLPNFIIEVYNKYDEDYLDDEYHEFWWNK